MLEQFLNGRWIAHRAWRAVLLVGFGLSSGPDAVGAESAAESAGQPPMIPVGLDAYRQWDRWPYQRIGARAYMRSTYDRSGGNETADASHFLYQVAEDFNVTLDVEGTGVLYFKRTNHWHGSPRFFFDDSQTPQAQGTGTEEWGGGGDYWGGRNMTIPLAGHPVGVRRAEDAANAEELIHSAYRFLLADLSPFGKRAVIRFEHGAINLSEEHYRSVAYWYGLPAASLVLTDQLNVGDADSEQAHGYHSPQASEPYEITSRYEWGPDTVPRSVSLQSETVLAEPRDFVEFEFEAAAGVSYSIWVRGKSAGGHLTDATWFQFDDRIGTGQLGAGHSHPKGFGNWRDDTPANTWSWSSALPGEPPQTVTFDRDGVHRLRVQLRHGPHQFDQIWLSASQKTRPKGARPIARPSAEAGLNQIVLDVGEARKVVGNFAVIQDFSASGQNAFAVGAAMTEIYPAHTETGRVTTGTSGFTVRVTTGARQ
jgi:hypothetical protein